MQLGGVVVNHCCKATFGTVHEQLTHIHVIVIKGRQ